jgi:hypothetical protein
MVGVVVGESHRSQLRQVEAGVDGPLGRRPPAVHQHPATAGHHSQRRAGPAPIGPRTATAQDKDAEVHRR